MPPDLDPDLLDILDGACPACGVTLAFKYRLTIHRCSEVAFDHGAYFVATSERGLVVSGPETTVVPLAVSFFHDLLAHGLLPALRVVAVIGAGKRPIAAPSGN